MVPQYVIQDPTTSYAIELMRRIRTEVGWKAVCFYTTAEAVPNDREKWAELFSADFVAAEYRVQSDGLAAFIEHLKLQHDVQAVVPHNELCLSHANTIATALRLSWSQPKVLTRFRDKHALKSHLAAIDPSLRLNFTTLVDDPRDVLSAVVEHGLKRFVLKPNDGYANVNIGIFDAGVSAEIIQAHCQQAPKTRWLLEEYVEGAEFHCDGQVDAEGNITIVDVGRGHIIETAQRAVVRTRTDQVARGAPEFDVLADYTHRVIKASGLRRSPFHAEMRIDDRGPCLIECGARLIGGEYAALCNEMHGPPFDVFALAAHYYVTDAPFGEIALNWARYDSRLFSRVRGVSTDAERLHSLEGVTEVESLPQFFKWIEKPFVGQSLAATNSLISSAYALLIIASSPEEIEQVVTKIRGLVRWNRHPMTPVSRCGFALGVLRRGIKRRLRRHFRSNKRQLVSFE